MTDTPPFIIGLHRPFNQQLKTATWVCRFIVGRDLKSSLINLEFYLWLLDHLKSNYTKKGNKGLSGVPSLAKVNAVTEQLGESNLDKKYTIIHEALKSENRTQSQKDIYSSYKAASYYVNMAKDKLKLIDDDNKLTEDGLILADINYNFFGYTKKERFILASKVIDADFLLIISLCLFKKASVKYGIKDYGVYQYDFLEKYYNIKRHKFTSQSLGNYNTVRSYWLDSLAMIDSRILLKKSYIDYIVSNKKHSEWYYKLLDNFHEYEKQELSGVKDQVSFNDNLLDIYTHLVQNGNSQLGFVNLYDIKDKMAVSEKKFRQYLASFYEKEKNARKIFFNNIVNSIDRRKRFEIRGVPFLQIKIK